ncbi:MAG: zinc ribbon domain-containing protein [Actinobacteria bacterium]|nr:zinc ribbon domain-containing protein [Actinomycetota bacterium]
MAMRCPMCDVENDEGSIFCKECGFRFSDSGGKTEGAGEPSVPVGPLDLAKFLSITWSRRGPILMSLFIVLLMSMVFAPWAFIRLDILGISLVSRRFSGWEIFVPRILFFLSIIPLIVSLMMTAGLGSRRLVVETHICTFFGGVMFTIWITTFTLSQVLKSVLKNIDVISVSVASGQIVTIFLFIGFIFGIILTSYDRGRKLALSKGGG